MGLPNKSLLVDFLTFWVFITLSLRLVYCSHGFLKHRVSLLCCIVLCCVVHRTYENCHRIIFYLFWFSLINKYVYYIFFPLLNTSKQHRYGYSSTSIPSNWSVPKSVSWSYSTRFWIGFEYHFGICCTECIGKCCYRCGSWNYTNWTKEIRTIIPFPCQAILQQKHEVNNSFDYDECTISVLKKKKRKIKSAFPLIKSYGNKRNCYNQLYWLLL